MVTEADEFYELMRTWPEGWNFLIKKMDDGRFFTNSSPVGAIGIIGRHQPEFFMNRGEGNTPYEALLSTYNKLCKNIDRRANS